MNIKFLEMLTSFVVEQKTNLYFRECAAFPFLSLEHAEICALIYSYHAKEMFRNKNDTVTDKFKWLKESTVDHSIHRHVIYASIMQLPTKVYLFRLHYSPLALFKLHN